MIRRHKQRPGSAEGQSTAVASAVDVAPIDVLTILAIIRQNLARVSGLAAAMVVLTAAVLYFVPPRFKSETALLISKHQVAVPVDASAHAPTAGISDQSITSKLDEIASAPVVALVTKELGLNADPEFNPGIKDRAHGASTLFVEIREFLSPITKFVSEYFHPTSGRVELKVLDNVFRAISVSVKPASHTIIVSATSTDPEKAAAIANALASSYLKYRLETQKVQTQRLEEWLGDRLAELRVEVTRHENEVERLRGKIGQYQGQTSSLQSEQLSQISRELLDTKAQLADAEAKRNHLKSLAGNSVDSSADDVLNSQLIQNLRQHEAQLLVQRAAAQSQYGNLNPALIALNQQVSEVRQKIATEITRIDRKVSEQIRVLNSKSATLASAQRELQAQIEMQNAALVHLRQVQNDADSDRATYQAFAIYRAKIAGAPTVDPVEVQVLSPAVPPLQPSSPNRKTILIAVGVGTFLLGMGGSILRASLAQDLRSAEQATALLGIPTWALIPKVRASQQIDMAIVDQPASALAESVRYLFTAIEKNATRRRRRALRVLISSALPDEGKTSTSRMLAREAALSGVKTLLLDLDLRRRVGRKEAKANFAVEIETEDATGLRILNVRPRMRRMFAVLHQAAFWQQMEELSIQYELMIIDSPPVLSVSDATTIARFADFTIFVVKWGETRIPAVVEGLRQLRAVNSTVAGLVLTQVDAKKHAMYGFGDSGVYTGRHAKYYIDNQP